VELQLFEGVHKRIGCGLTLFLEDNEAGFEYGYAEATGRKPIVKNVNLV